MTPLDRLLSVEETARILGVSVRTTRRILPAARIYPRCGMREGFSVGS
jgi:hypothetical protein